MQQSVLTKTVRTCIAQHVGMKAKMNARAVFEHTRRNHNKKIWSKCQQLGPTTTTTHLLELSLLISLSLLGDIPLSAQPLQLPSPLSESSIKCLPLSLHTLEILCEFALLCLGFLFLFDQPLQLLLHRGGVEIAAVPLLAQLVKLFACLPVPAHIRNASAYLLCVPHKTMHPYHSARATPLSHMDSRVMRQSGRQPHCPTGQCLSLDLFTRHQRPYHADRTQEHVLLITHKPEQLRRDLAVQGVLHMRVHSTLLWLQLRDMQISDF
jgi:hypothetical protein